MYVAAVALFAILMARRDYVLDEGLSDAASLGLSAFTLPLEPLGMIRELGNQSLEQARSLAAAGQMDAALKVAQDVVNVGRTVSSSGRFLVHDRVGIALQQAQASPQKGDRANNHLSKIKGRTFADWRGIMRVTGNLTRKRRGSS